jgi:hypothetical protein
MKVIDPQGQTWRVHRRWLPWNPKSPKLAENADGLSVDVPDVGDDLGIVGVVLFFVALILLIPFIALLVLIGIELILFAVVLPFAVVGRMFFGKHWWVQTRRGWKLASEEMVGDWTASGIRIRELARDLALHGGPALPDDVEPPSAGGLTAAGA